MRIYNKVPTRYQRDYQRKDTKMSLVRDTYLGDGLYAGWDGYQFRLYAWNGIVVTNEVFLDPEVIQSFESFVKQVREVVKEYQAVAAAKEEPKS